MPEDSGRSRRLTSVQSAVLQTWHRRAQAEEAMHRVASQRLARQSTLIAITIVVISAIVGSSFLAQVTLSTTAEIGLAFLAVVSAVLTSVQKLTRLSERAGEHALVMRGYGRLRRELEVALSSAGAAGDATKVLSRIKADFDRIEQEAPDVPLRLRAAAERAHGVEDAIR